MFCFLFYQKYLKCHLLILRNIINQCLHIYSLIGPIEPFIEKISHQGQIIIMKGYSALSKLVEIHQVLILKEESQIEALLMLTAHVLLTFFKIELLHQVQIQNHICKVHIRTLW